MASAPRNLTATAGEASVALAWQVPASDGGGSISGYRVYRSTVAGGAGSELGTLGSVQNFTDTTAVPGTTYYYTVTALNSAGEGPRSNEASATPLAPMVEIPGVRGNWVGNYGSDGYALFAWTASSDLVLLPSASLAIEQGARSATGVVMTCVPWRARMSPSGAWAPFTTPTRSGCD